MSKKKNNVKNKTMKRIAFTLKSSEQDGTVFIKGHANKNIIDRGNDRIEPGEYKLEDYFKNPIMLLNHNSEFEIGRVVEAKVEADGLVIKGEISNSDDPVTTRVRNNIKQGILKSLSIGFSSSDSEKGPKGENLLKGVDIMEISVVGIPMNQDSQFSVVGKTIAARRKYVCKMLDDMAKKSENEEEKPEENPAEGEEEKAMKIGKTSETNGHWHEAEYDDVTGNGKTTITHGSEDHVHQIVNQNVLPLEDGLHEHELLGVSDPEPKEIESVEEEEDKGCDCKGEEDCECEENEKEPEEVENEEKPEEGEEEGKAEEGDGSVVQTLIFSKESFNSSEEVLAWVEEHGFEGGDVADNGSSYRLRQRDSADFVEGSLKTVQLAEGVSAVIGKPKDLEKCLLSFNEIVFKHIDLGNALGSCVFSAVKNSGKSVEDIRVNNCHWAMYVQYKSSQKQALAPEQDGVSGQMDTSPQALENENPLLLAAQQTNILLGKLISEMQILRQSVEKQVEKEPIDVNEPKEPETQPGEQEGNEEDDKEDEDAELPGKAGNSTIDIKSSLSELKNSNDELVNTYLDNLSKRLTEVTI